MSDGLEIRPLSSDAERAACARLMSESEPWLTLGRGYDASLAIISDPSCETYCGSRLGRGADASPTSTPVPSGPTAAWATSWSAR